MATNAEDTPISQTQRERLDLEKIRAEINKMIAETGKINREARYYPIIAIAAFLTSLYAAYRVIHG